MSFSFRTAVVVVIGVLLVTASACSAPPMGRHGELSDKAKDLLGDAEKDLFLYRFDTAMQKVDQVLAMHPDSREALKMVYQVRLAQLNSEAFLADRQREESSARANRDSLRSGILPPDKAPLDRSLIQLKPGITEVESLKVREKLEKKISQLDLLDADLDAVLYKIFQEAEINIATDPGNFSGKKFTIRGKDMTVRYLLENIARTQGLSFTVDDENVWIVSTDNPVFIVRTYRLNTGLTRANTSGGYEGLGTIGFLGQTTKTGQGGGGGGGGGLGGGLGGGIGGGLGGGSKDKDKSHVELLLEKLPELLPSWPKGSQIYQDKKQNLVIVRSTREAIEEIDKLMKLVDEVPKQINIESRFVQIRGEENFDFGVNWDFQSPTFKGIDPTTGNSVDLTTPDFTADNPSGNYLNSVVNADIDANKNAQLGGTKTDFSSGLPSTATVGATNLSLKGVFRDRPFQAVLTAVEKTSFASLVSAPSVTVANNNTATIGVTKNLPFIEEYEVQQISTGAVPGGFGVITQTTPVVVAKINDENFQGRALVVTPSVGADGKTITVYIQPVIKTRVEDIPISGAVIGAGLTVPDVLRPVLETKFVTTQVSVTDGDTVVIGGLITDEETSVDQKVPLLGDLPLIGSLFSRKSRSHDKVNLYIFITVKIISPQGSLYQ